MNVNYASRLAGPAFPHGEVWLAGAGPGDPGLLTLRALVAIEQADLILHDALPGRAVLRHARRGAEVVNVGKRKGAAPIPQAKINQRLVEGARTGRRVLWMMPPKRVSSSRTTALATKAAATNSPNKVRISVVCAITNGALTCTLPPLPPMVSWSEAAAPKAISRNTAKVTQNAGERS